MRKMVVIVIVGLCSVSVLIPSEFAATSSERDFQIRRFIRLLL